MTAPEVAVEAVRAILHDEFGGKIGYCHHEADCPEPGQYYRRCEPSARRAIAALVGSEEVRGALVAALPPGSYLWRSTDGEQFARFERDEVVDAILAALSPSEARGGGAG